MINKIRKLGKTPIKAPSGNNPTPAPIAVAIPVPPYLPQGVFTIWPNNKAPILIAGIQLAYPSKTKGKVDKAPLKMSTKNTITPNLGDISE